MNRKLFFTLLNYAYALMIAAGGGYWLYTGDTFGIVMGLAAGACVVGILKQWRWGYFITGAWCFGLLKLGLDKFSEVYSGPSVKHLFMGAALLGIVLAVVLHEALAKPKAKAASEPDQDIPN
ncbi:hypothetical protein [Halioxenophilus sp. WMMB6]|uniref:hypothetical protein n=1 Tax=Halioxenophilus sp. WMMB6 TaxID=3073815 RepID=UPI00295EBF42|nr:hypothetical protein [Halioxenophilus sp. WMMB6]